MTISGIASLAANTREPGVTSQRPRGYDGGNNKGGAVELEPPQKLQVGASSIFVHLILSTNATNIYTQKKCEKLF